MNFWKDSPISIDISTGMLAGEELNSSKKTLKDLEGVFLDENVRKTMDQETIVYTVQAYLPVKEGTKGGLYFGNSTIYPGKVGKEYFMTRGHFHANKNTAEFYWCISGEGFLIFMDENRFVWAELMRPGSMHYIPGKVAHRVSNTGDDKLVFNACWPSEAGHDYSSINTYGFSARILELNNKPELTIS